MWLSAPNLADIQCMTAASHAKKMRFKGQMSRSHDYENAQSCTVNSELCSCGHMLLLLLAWDCMSIRLHRFFLVIICMRVFFRLVCEAEMEVTRAKLASVITEIARITPLTPDGNRTQSWPIGKLSVMRPF